MAPVSKPRPVTLKPMAAGPRPPQRGSRVRRESRATALNSMRMEKGSPTSR